MTIEEAKKALEQLKKEGYSDEDIVKTLYLMYANDKMCLSDLRTLTELMGYEFTEEFEAMSEEDKKTKGLQRIGSGDSVNVDEPIPEIIKTNEAYSQEEISKLKKQRISLDDAARMMAERYGRTVKESRRILRECDDRGISYAEAIASGATLSDGMTMHEAAQKITWLISNNDTKFIKRILKAFLKIGKTYAQVISVFENSPDDASLDDVACIYACYRRIPFEDAKRFIEGNRIGDESYASVLIREKENANR